MPLPHPQTPKFSKPFRRRVCYPLILLVAIGLQAPMLNLVATQISADGRALRDVRIWITTQLNALPSYSDPSFQAEAKHWMAENRETVRTLNEAVISESLLRNRTSLTRKLDSLPALERAAAESAIEELGYLRNNPEPFSSAPSTARSTALSALLPIVPPPAPSQIDPELQPIADAIRQSVDRDINLREALTEPSFASGLRQEYLSLIREHRDIATARRQLASAVLKVLQD